ncbi:MAG: hypothetical protein QXP84_05870 [Candidatus Korarchaeum sp.]
MVEVVHHEDIPGILKRELRGREVRVITERDFRIAIGDGGLIPFIIDKEIFKRSINADYNVRFTYLLPTAIILHINLRRPGGKKWKYSLIFLPRYFTMVEIIGNALTIGFWDKEGSFLSILKLGDHVLGECRLLSFIRIMSGLSDPRIVESFHADALKLLEDLFPRANWLIDYYTRESQVEV